MRLALLALLLPVAAQAQTVLTPGHPDLVPAEVQSVQFERRVSGETPRLIDFWLLGETREAADRLVLTERVTATLDVPGYVQTTAVTWPSLAPVSVSLATSGETYTVAFSDGRIRGPRRLGNLRDTLDAPLPGGVFADGTETRIVRSLPFRDGYTATFRTVDASGEVTTDSVRVGPRVTVTPPGGAPTAAWTVRLRAGEAPPTTYLVDAATRALLRASYDFSPGREMESVLPPAPPPGEALRPGSTRLDLTWLGDETAAYTLRLTEPFQRDVGTLRVMRRVAGGVATLETRLEDGSGVGGSESVTTATADAATLRPLTSVTRGDDLTASLAYAPGRVSGTHGTADTLTVALGAPVFDAAWAAEIARSLPLADGTVVYAETYGAAHGLRTVSYRVSRGDGGTWTVASAGLDLPIVYTLDAARGIVSMRISPEPGVVVEFVRHP